MADNSNNNMYTVSLKSGVGVDEDDSPLSFIDIFGGRKCVLAFVIVIAGFFASWLGILTTEYTALLVTVYGGFAAANVTQWRKMGQPAADSNPTTTTQWYPYTTQQHTYTLLEALVKDEAVRQEELKTILNTITDTLQLQSHGVSFLVDFINEEKSKADTQRG